MSRLRPSGLTASSRLSMLTGSTTLDASSNLAVGSQRMSIQTVPCVSNLP